MTLNALYSCAERNSINIHHMKLEEVLSLSLPSDNICINNGMQLLSEEKACLAHEIGHCITGSFYNIYAKLDIRAKHEHRANRWAYEHLLPYDELMHAVDEGLTEVWEIADFLNFLKSLQRTLSGTTRSRSVRQGKTVSS